MPFSVSHLNCFPTMVVAGFMTYTPARHQVMIEMFWLHFWEAVRSSVFTTVTGWNTIHLAFMYSSVFTTIVMSSVWTVTPIRQFKLISYPLSHILNGLIFGLKITCYCFMLSFTISFIETIPWMLDNLTLFFFSELQCVSYGAAQGTLEKKMKRNFWEISQTFCEISQK